MRRNFFFYTLVVALLGIYGCTGTAENTFETKFGSEGGYDYEYSTNDPTNTRIYTLENGLKVYLSRYTDEPRIPYVPDNAPVLYCQKGQIYCLP